MGLRRLGEPRAREPVPSSDADVGGYGFRLPPPPCPVNGALMPVAIETRVYRDFIVKEPVQFTGFKLFYKNDKPMMTFDEVLSLSPQPAYIQYQ
jgi:hypothetical protein